MICPVCGRNVETGSKFCVYCGANLAELAFEQGKKPARKGWKTATIILSVLLILLSTAFSLSFSQNGITVGDLTLRSTLSHRSGGPLIVDNLGNHSVVNYSYVTSQWGNSLDGETVILDCWLPKLSENSTSKSHFVYFYDSKANAIIHAVNTLYIFSYILDEDYLCLKERCTQARHVRIEGTTEKQTGRTLFVIEHVKFVE